MLYFGAHGRRKTDTLALQQNIRRWRAGGSRMREGYSLGGEKESNLRGTWDVSWKGSVSSGIVWKEGAAKDHGQKRVREKVSRVLLCRKERTNGGDPWTRGSWGSNADRRKDYLLKVFCKKNGGCEGTPRPKRWWRGNCQAGKILWGLQRNWRKKSHGPKHTSVSQAVTEEKPSRKVKNKREKSSNEVPSGCRKNEGAGEVAKL